MNFRNALFFLLAFTVNLSTLKAYTSFEDTENGARPIGIAGAYVGLANTGDMLFINPGGLGFFSGGEITGFYSKPYGLDELAYGSISIIHSTKWGGFGYGHKTYGFKLYRETTHLISFGKRYGSRFSYGMNIRLMHLSIARYGSATTIGIDVGLLAKITDSISWGFYTRNINAPTLGQRKEQLPQIFTTGFSYQPIKELIVNLDYYKDVRFPTMVKFGVEYTILNFLALRTGVSTEPSRFAAGMGIIWKKIRIDYAFYNHPDLGFTHQTSFALQF